PRDVRVERPRSARRRTPVPELLDKPLGRNRTTYVHEQERQQRALARTTETEPLTVTDSLDGTKQVELDGRSGHATSIVRPRTACNHPSMRIAEMNWMQVEEYLARDDRVVLPIGSTEQHGYLSLAVDLILAERVSVEAAEPLGVPVLPVMPFGVAPGFTAYPGTVSLRLETLVTVLREALDPLYGQGFRRFLVVNGHGGNTGAEAPLVAWAAEHDGARLRFHSWWASERTLAASKALHANPTHANWFENFPWTRLEGVSMPREEKPMAEIDELGDDPADVREMLGDGTFGGAYERPDEDM